MNDTEFSVVSSIYTLGGLSGALLAGPLSTKYGRLLTMRATTLVFVLGPIAEALAASIAVISIGRLVSGLGAGAAIVVGPIYIAEISPPHQRGLLGAGTQVMINLGIVIAQTLGFFLSKGNLWRIILACAGFLGALELAGLFFAPESPKWLAENKHPTQGRRILQRIRGRDVNIDAEVKDWKVSEPSAEEEESLLAPPTNDDGPRQSHVTIFSAIRSPKYRPAIIAVIAVMMAQQLTGINSVVMYSVSILSSILPTAASLITVLVGVVNLLMTIACAPLADKIGRKTSLLLSIAGMGICAVLLATGLAFNIKVLSAVATLLLVASFAVGLGPVPFILASELVGPEAVGATQSWALVANWISTFAVAQFFPILNDALGGRGRAYWVFAGLAVVLGSFIAYWVPETRGKANADEVWGRGDDRRRID